MMYDGGKMPIYKKEKGMNPHGLRVTKNLFTNVEYDALQFLILLG